MNLPRDILKIIRTYTGYSDDMMISISKVALINAGYHLSNAECKYNNELAMYRNSVKLNLIAFRNIPFNNPDEARNYLIPVIDDIRNHARHVNKLAILKTDAKELYDKQKEAMKLSKK